MWPSVVVLYIIVSVTPAEFSVIFSKCCPVSQFLIHNIDAQEPRQKFECVDQLFNIQYLNVTETALVFGDSVQVNVGFPENCEKYVMFENIRDVTTDNHCFDRLISEVINETFHKITPRLISVQCRSDEQTASNGYILHQIRKCCPKGQSYNTNTHTCQGDIRDLSVFDLFEQDSVAVVEIDYGLRCKTEEYAIEMSNTLFSLQIDNSSLTVSRHIDKRVMSFPKGEWCIERSATAENEVVARGCSQQCPQLSSFCLRKCCPVGEHFQPRQCGRDPSNCVPDHDQSTVLNLSHYLRGDPSGYSFATMGLRSILQCPNGKFKINRNNLEDAHYLTTSGRMVLPPLLGGETNDYCIEAFDDRTCGGQVHIEALACFIPLEPVDKNFTISFVMITISCVCLFLTLVVYMGLAELRNLHGRTLICHVLTMLIAYCCLARVQYGRVKDESACRMLGYGIYFGFIAAFCWLNVMCFDIWWTFGSIRSVQPMRKASSERRRFLWYSMYAWSLSATLTLAMLLLDLFPLSATLDANIGQGYCWFGSRQNSKSDWPHLIFFVIPMGAVVCINLVLWVLTARHCSRVKAEVHRLQAGSVGDRTKKRFRADRARYVLTVKLWVVMGAGWFWELVDTLVSEPRWLWGTLDLINELQGVSIFLILVMKPKVYFLIRKKLGLEKDSGTRSGASSSAARTSTTFLSRSISAEEKTRIYINGDKLKK